MKVSGINISENLKYQFTSYLDAVVNLGYNTSTATRDGVKNSITWYTYDGTLSTAKTNAINNPNQAIYGIFEIFCPVLITTLFQAI